MFPNKDQLKFIKPIIIYPQYISESIDEILDSLLKMNRDEQRDFLAGLIEKIYTNGEYQGRCNARDKLADIFYVR